MNRSSDIKPRDEFDVTKQLFHCSLLTHTNSAYFRNSTHDNFEEVINYLGIDSFDIYSKNFYDDNDLSVTSLITQIKELFSFAIGVFRLRKIVMNNSNPTFTQGTRHILIDISTVLRLFLFYFLSIFRLKPLPIFVKMLLRQSNISAGHFQLMQNAIWRGDKYLLILEDDFHLIKLTSLKSQLNFALEVLENNSNLNMLNMSESFTNEELGHYGFVQNNFTSPNHPELIVSRLPHPVTNTVCATIYRTDFLLLLARELRLMDDISLIPIDHKINFALMKMIKRGSLNADCYATLVPGLFIQGSLHG
jgi:hypothetical protein